MTYLELIENDWRDSTGEIDSGRVTWLIERCKESQPLIENIVGCWLFKYTGIEMKAKEWLKEVNTGSKPVEGK